MNLNETIAPINVLGIGGSTRPGSRNGIALRVALERARRLGAATDIIDLETANLPLLNSGLELADCPPSVARFLEAVRAADGFVLASPVYHGGISGAFKNALDLLVYGSDDYLNGKPVGLMALGGANGAPVLDMMTTTVHALKGLVMPTRVLVPHGVVSDDGSMSDAGVIDRLDRMVADVIKIASAFRALEFIATPDIAFVR